jgi:hypothetical protein
MNDMLYDTLEQCLRAVEEGADPEAVLERHPELAQELRPLLDAAWQVRGLIVPEASPDALRRGRQRLLQRADRMRPVRRPVIPLIQRLAFSVALATVFLLSGTGLVNASTTTLPGDQLYPVKRTWEDVRLLFVFAPMHREALEGEYEQERLDEVGEVLQKGRQVQISFSGLVTSQQNGSILVSGVPVATSPQTRYTGEPPVVGSSVLISGQTDMNGHVIALSVQVLPPGSLVPVGEPEDGHEQATALPQGGATPPAREPQNPEDSGESSGHQSTFHLEGTVQSMDGTVWVVDGRTVYLDLAQVPGGVAVGMRVEVKGYFTSDGRFVVTSVEAKSSESEEKDKKQEEDQKQQDGDPDPEQEHEEEHEGDGEHQEGEH